MYQRIRPAGAAVLLRSGPASPEGKWQLSLVRSGLHDVETDAVQADRAVLPRTRGGIHGAAPRGAGAAGRPRYATVCRTSQARDGFGEESVAAVAGGKIWSMTCEPSAR